MAMNFRLLRPVATGFDPRRISGLVQWYDAADQSTMTLNGSTVSEWRSKVNNVAVSQGTAANQPTLTTGYYNGRSALTFDGGDFLYNASLPIQVNGASIGAVFDETTRVGEAGIIVGSPSSGSDFDSASALAFYLHAGGNRPVESLGDAGRINARSPSVSEASALGKVVAMLSVAQSNGTTGNAVLRYNGTAGTADTTYTAALSSSGTLIGGRYILGGVWGSLRFTGRMLEICVWNRALTTTECQAFERYANRKWGTTA